MMLKLLGKRDASDCGLTVLELLHMSIMYLRMSEMGEDSLYFLNTINILLKFVEVYNFSMQMGSFRGS